MALDLAVTNVSKMCEDGYEFELMLQGVPTGAFMKVRGPDSAVVRDYSKKKYNEMEYRKKMAQKRNKDDDMDIDELEDFLVESLAIRVISWKGFEEDGKAIPFSKENVERILKNHTWIREQVKEASEDLGNFIKV